MTNTIALIASLYFMHVHGTKKDCQNLAKSLLNIAVSDAMNPQEPIHFDEDLDAIKSFKKECSK